MNIPNALTIFRLFLVPVFVFTYLFSPDPNIRYVAAGVFVLASLTDVLDGYIARKYNMITDFGKLADPVADKLMQITAIGLLVYDNKLSYWVLIIFVIKEALQIIGGLRLLNINKYVVQSEISGKVATVILFFVIVAIIIFDMPKKYATIMIWVSLVFTIIAFFNYFQTYLNIISKKNSK